MRHGKRREEGVKEGEKWMEGGARKIFLVTFDNKNSLNDDSMYV